MEIEKEIKKILFKHIDPKIFKIFLFGSRADGTAKKWSDWDIGVQGEKPLPFEIMTSIEEDLQSSDIPYLVEVVDFQKVSPEFRQQALKRTKLWKP